ncbi:MAG: hypothetical protein JSR83_14850 [Proteobacteria bacterium]|nr:hypothetical protein [Pseudomonadota bacterium]
MNTHELVAILLSASLIAACGSGQRLAKGSSGQVSVNAVPRDVPVYLKKGATGWTASLDGSVRDPSVERVLFRKDTSWQDEPILAFEKEDDKHGKAANCIRKYSDRNDPKGGNYGRCNSSFYTEATAGSAAYNVARGILSLGLGTINDASSDTFSVIKTFDHSSYKEALDASRAAEVARAGVGLLNYRQEFQKARTITDFKLFVSNYEGVFDPENRVAVAKRNIAEISEREQAERIRAEQAAQQEVAAQKVIEATIKFGDSILVRGFTYGGIPATVLEVRKPLVHVQWGDGYNMGESTRWIQLDQVKSIVKR